MEEDDIIAELHETRRKLLEKAGGTLEGYVKQLMEEQKKNPEGYVDLRKRKPVRPKANAPARKPGRRRKAVAQ